MQKFTFIRLKAKRVKPVAGLIERSDPFLDSFLLKTSLELQ